MLEVIDLTAGYLRQPVVRDLTFSVTPGRVSLILGVNGAGKSTTLRTIAGLHPCTGGAVLVDGKDATGSSADAMVRRGLVLVPEGRHVFAPLTVEENLKLGGYRRTTAQTRAGLERSYAAFPILAERRRGQAGLLSGGEQQMLAIARGLMSGPRVMLLDEPSMGLAPVIIDDVMTSISAIADDGVAVLMVEQNVDVALSIADEVRVMARGEFVHTDLTPGAQTKEKILEALLGKGRTDRTVR